MGTDDEQSEYTRRVLAPNSGPMTLDGTNSYIVAAPGSSSVVVVDPGPLIDSHLDMLASHGDVELILITHRHPDHTDASVEFAARTGAQVRAIDPAHCHGGAPLVDGDVIEVAGTTIQVLATPGHTDDSACFILPADGPYGSALTGDTILGRGTSIIAHPDGGLGPYLASLERLRELGRATVLPGHGPTLGNLADICDAYLAHRAERLEMVRGALERLGRDASVEAIADDVYADVDRSLRFAAEASLRAQLDYLRGF